MIINLSKSNLFTLDPDLRFSLQYETPRGLWNLIFNRYKYLELEVPDLIQLYQIKTGKEIDYFAMRRWVWRTEVYRVAEPFVKKGAQTVISDIFGKYENDIIKELTKHIKRGATKDSKILI